MSSFDDEIPISSNDVLEFRIGSCSLIDAIFSDFPRKGKLSNVKFPVYNLFTAKKSDKNSFDNIPEEICQTAKICS